MKMMVRCLNQTQEITIKGDGFVSASCEFIFEPSEDERVINHCVIYSETLGFTKLYISTVLLSANIEHQIVMNFEGI